MRQAGDPAHFEPGDALPQTGQIITSVERIGRGGNSRVYLVTCAGPEQYAVKLYPGPSADGRNRLVVEYEALRFLWDNGARCIPRPVAADHDNNTGVYEYVQGVPATMAALDDGHLAQALDFISNLKRLGGASGADRLPLAAEACFSMRALLDNIKKRLAILNDVPDEGPEYGLLREFMSEGVGPAFSEITLRAERRMKAAGIPPDMDIHSGLRTPSPSDFGFHNAIVRPDGTLAFIDFEYFGWDDPVKMISDFLLHPAMDLSDGMKRAFTQGALGIFGADDGIRERLAAMFPLFAVKWVAIMLNEFVPGHPRKRGFAGAADNEGDGGLSARTRQLAKARALIDDIVKRNGEFEYF
jgi:hypothetical protein